MFPVLLSLGNFSISTYGVFLALSFLFGLFLVWRLARGWELNEEKVLDLTLITFMGGLIGARIYFAIDNPSIGFDISKILLIHRYPGFSFWGGLLGAWLTLAFFADRVKIGFWQAADIAAVGLLGGIILADIGCLLGGCDVGIQSGSLFAVPIVGALGRTIPVQLIEAVLFIILLRYIWSMAIHFHSSGRIISITLMFIGLIKLVVEPLKAERVNLSFALVLIALGVIIFYRVTKRKPLDDLKYGSAFPFKFVSDSHFRKTILVATNKKWYNKKVSFNVNIKRLFKRIGGFNVGFSHKDSKYYKKGSS